MGAVRREGQTKQAGIIISIIISQRTPFFRGPFRICQTGS